MPSMNGQVLGKVHSHPGLSCRVTLQGASAIARTSGCKDAAAVAQDRDAPRLIDSEPISQTIKKPGNDCHYTMHPPVLHAITKCAKADLQKLV